MPNGKKSVIDWFNMNPKMMSTEYFQNKVDQWWAHRRKKSTRWWWFQPIIQIISLSSRISHHTFGLTTLFVTLTIPLCDWNRKKTLYSMPRGEQIFFSSFLQTFSLSFCVSRFGFGLFYLPMLASNNLHTLMRTLIINRSIALHGQRANRCSFSQWDQLHKEMEREEKGTLQANWKKKCATEKFTWKIRHGRSNNNWFRVVWFKICAKSNTHNVCVCMIMLHAKENLRKLYGLESPI